MTVRTSILASLVLALVLTSCSSNDNPVAPPGDKTVPNPMVRLVGTPHVKVTLTANLLETAGADTISATIQVIVADSTDVAIFLPDVRLNGVPMREETTSFGQPFRYVLNGGELPDFAVGDSLVLEVRDGGARTPPFACEMLPSALVLPPDGTVVHRTSGVTVPWTGAIDRVILTLIDITTKRLRVVVQAENFTGLGGVEIPGRDLGGLALGSLVLGGDVLDVEILNVGPFQQKFTSDVKQARDWTLAP